MKTSAGSLERRRGPRAASSSRLLALRRLISATASDATSRHPTRRDRLSAPRTDAKSRIVRSEGTALPIVFVDGEPRRSRNQTLLPTPPTRLGPHQDGIAQGDRASRCQSGDPDHSVGQPRRKLGVKPDSGRAARSPTVSPTTEAAAGKVTSRRPSRHFSASRAARAAAHLLAQGSPIGKRCGWCGRRRHQE